MMSEWVVILNWKYVAAEPSTSINNFISQIITNKI